MVVNMANVIKNLLTLYKKIDLLFPDAVNSG